MRTHKFIRAGVWATAHTARTRHGERARHGTALHTDTAHLSYSRNRRQYSTTRHNFHLLETQDGTARNGAALRPTSALRDDSHEETTKFRFAVTKVSFERQDTEISER